MPFLSVLLPTRNRLEFLAQSIQTVLAQDDGDLEIIVSDNCSDEDVAGHVASLGDRRIKYLRSDRFVPVTANWNRALDASSGDYVLMLGDDDGLTPGFVTALRGHHERFDSPDMVYSSAWLLAYPGVMPEAPDGYAMDYGYAEFLKGHDEPFELTHSQAMKMVQQAMRFRVAYGFNMQFATISRGLIDRLSQAGPFFQSPFPDYYAMNVAMMNARCVAVDPARRVIIGVTPKSYGFFHANARESEGKEFLGQDADPQTAKVLDEVLLPGSNINAGWLAAIETIASRYPDLVPSRPAHRRFRLLQIRDVMGRRATGDLTDEQERELLRQLGAPEKLFARSWKASASLFRRVLPRRIRAAFANAGNRFLVRQYIYWQPAERRESGLTMVGFYEELERLAKTTV